jgi:hypothetical protein
MRLFKVVLKDVLSHLEVLRFDLLLGTLNLSRHPLRFDGHQLRGRSGRQGDPGESRFYLSLQDELMRLFKPEVLRFDLLLGTLNLSRHPLRFDGHVLGHLEGHHGKYDDVMNRQRHVIYGDRRKVLEGADVEAELRATTDSKFCASTCFWALSICRDTHFDSMGMSSGILRVTSMATVAKSWRGLTSRLSCVRLPTALSPQRPGNRHTRQGPNQPDIQSQSRSTLRQGPSPPSLRPTPRRPTIAASPNSARQLCDSLSVKSC